VNQPIRTLQRLVDPQVSLSFCQELATELYNNTIETCVYLRYVLILLYQQAFRRTLVSFLLKNSHLNISIVN